MAYYKRVLLKLSGEALAGERQFGFDMDEIRHVCECIKECVDLGTQMAIVVGGGNFWRGRTSRDMDKIKADHIGMLATVMNSLALSDMLRQVGVEARVQTAIAIQGVAEPYARDAAVRHLEEGKVVIFGCGTGNPCFSTDTAAALRAAEIGADILFKATLVDGIYDSDPKKNPDAKRYDQITYSEVLEKNLKVMDGAAAAICRDNGVSMLLFNLDKPENMINAVKGEKIGTIVKED